MTARRLVSIIAIALMTVVGCSSPDSNSADQKDKIRHDPDPLTKRFPLIENPTSVSWITWNNQGGRAPGPTTHWIQAVVELQPEVANGLRASFKLSISEPNQFESTVRSSIPPGPYMSGAEFDEAFSKNGWKVGVHLQADGNILLIDAVD
ncbi:hypothetical protein ACFC06_21410 [Nocardia sp. NPDC056064]|uniref:hypothetical protein n=1 Tax=Nocardia sp. NPDC056064 TaxID=3345701 RepID=UPI0035E344A1